MVALATQWHIHVLSADHRLAVLARRTEREARILLAELANRSQLLDLFTLRNKGEHGRESSSHERTLQR